MTLLRYWKYVRITEFQIVYWTSACTLQQVSHIKSHRKYAFLSLLAQPNQTTVKTYIRDCWKNKSVPESKETSAAADKATVSLHLRRNKLSDYACFRTEGGCLPSAHARRCLTFDSSVVHRIFDVKHMCWRKKLRGKWWYSTLLAT